MVKKHTFEQAFKTSVRLTDWQTFEQVFTLAAFAWQIENGPFIDTAKKEFDK